MRLRTNNNSKTGFFFLNKHEFDTLYCSIIYFPLSNFNKRPHITGKAYGIKKLIKITKNCLNDLEFSIERSKKDAY